MNTAFDFPTMKEEMQVVKLEIRKNAYYDSVTLMIISKDLKKLPGVKEALVGMGTDLNKEISHNIKLNSPELDAITGNDFFVAVECETEDVMKTAIAKVDELLNKKKEISIANYYPPTLESALKIDPDLNLALISVPGKYAAGVAHECLDKDINVMLFSDNVSLEDEKKLKEKAVAKGLLMMGPDCGTAIVNHVPLAFANVVSKGDIGIVAASGTGLQEVTCIIDQMGAGITQALGTGGRDLKDEIGGLMYNMELDALINDPSTKVILCIAKPPGKDTQTKMLKKIKDGGKPAVVFFIGGNPQEVEDMGLVGAVSLEDSARKIVALSRGETPVTFEGFDIGEEAAEKFVKDEIAKYAPTQKYFRGFYSGGTLCDEAIKIMIHQLGDIYSNIPLKPENQIENKDISREHTCLDFGDDEFTRGRPHPMIDTSIRVERIIREGNDPEVAIVVLDCVIGYGSCDDPATDLAEAMVKAQKIAESQGRHITYIASVCGTEKDFQGLTKSRDTLRNSGAMVMPNNAQAIHLAMKILKELENR